MKQKIASIFCFLVVSFGVHGSPPLPCAVSSHGASMSAAGASWCVLLLLLLLLLLLAAGSGETRHGGGGGGVTRGRAAAVRLRSERTMLY